MQIGDKKAYSEALLSCSVSQRMITACPVAFGEVGVRQRIKSVLNYKKPAFWVVLVALIASVAIGVCFMTDPVEWNTDYENQENVWTFNPASSASSNVWLTFFFDDVKKLEKVEADFGKAQIDDVLKNAIIWMPYVNETDKEFDEATVKVHALRKNHSKVVFDILIISYVFYLLLTLLRDSRAFQLIKSVILVNFTSQVMLLQMLMVVL